MALVYVRQLYQRSGLGRYGVASDTQSEMEEVE
jgi:hypothetical protein